MTARNGACTAGLAWPEPGATFETADVHVTETMRREFVRLGGFTHPLFARPGEVRLPAGSPLPGQAVLLLMAGLVEQSGRVDDAIALLGMREVRFRQPVVSGAKMRVVVEMVGHRRRSAGGAVRDMRWTAVDDTGSVLAEAFVQLLVSDSGTDDAVVG